LRTRAIQRWNNEKIRKLQARLLAWYRQHKRVLPWRADPTPYRVWIAEIMLQQTRVQAVLPYYERFLARFPDVSTLAAASEGEVLELWAGLGYYRRARDLRNAAGRIIAELGGEFPRTFAGIMRLPGVGRYTAGAIHSIAFNQPQPVVDGNVRRVIGRLQGITSAPDSYYWHQSESWLARSEPADFNQAVMELGALVCVPAHPHCEECPLRSLCKSGRHRRVPPSPRRSVRAPESVELVMLVLECAGSIVLARQAEAEFIPGEWGLPVCILDADGRPLSRAGDLAHMILGSRPRLNKSAPVHHAITHRRILAHVYRAAVPSPLPRLAAGGRFEWFPCREINRLLTSSLFRKGLATKESGVRSQESECVKIDHLLE
jgi:A/G-specific adenine glycosylase